MTKKSNLTLDKRIKSIDDIQTCLEYDDKFINEKGYFFDNFVQAKNLTKCHYGTLVDIYGNNSDDNCFKISYESWERIDYFRFFIPESLLKPVEKKFRPYKDVEEFFNDVGCTLGDVIRFRKKDTTEEEYHTLLTGFKGDARVNIGLGDGGYYSLNDLFSLFELYTSNGWKPFGVLDD